MYKDKLKYLRESARLTQDELAKGINITRGQYCHYETEYEIIPLKHLISICNYFHVSLDYIFDFSSLTQYNYFSENINLNKAGSRLKEIRRENNLTQDKLARKINVARTIISKYEKGEFLIATHTLYSICKSYNISADYLIGRIDSPKYLK